MSSTFSPSCKGQQRTRNAQAQADLRARRKAYIKSLEDTVSSLEACVRSLRAQNSDLISSSSSSSFSYKHPKFCDEVERLKGENARLHTLLAEAGLAAAAATRLAKMGKDSPLPLPESEIGSEALEKSNTEAKRGKEEGESWSNTSSITIKKRKLTKMQAFAKDVDSQIHSLPSLSSTPLLSSAAVEPQNTPAAFETGAMPSEHPDQQAIYVYMTSTPSTSSSSRASVVSHRSPKTPRFDAVEIPPQKTDFSFDPAQGLPLTHAERPWPPSTNPSISIPFSQVAPLPHPPPPPPPPQQQQQQLFIPPPQNLHQTELLTTWLDHQLSPHWPASTPATTIPSSSASISDARSSTFQLLLLLLLLFTFPSPLFCSFRALERGDVEDGKGGKDGFFKSANILEPAILV